MAVFSLVLPRVGGERTVGLPENMERGGTWRAWGNSREG